MAALDMHEQEQVDSLKAWWKENGLKLILAVVVAAVVVGSVLGWRWWQAKQQADAAQMFGEVMKQASSNDPKRVDDAAAMVVNKHGSTIYAVRAQLAAAQVNIEAKNTATAATQLQWVIDHGSDEGLPDVARLKLASLRLDEKKYDDAMKLLDAAHPESFDSMYLDLKGDVYSAQGKRDEARAAYQQAVAKADPKNSFRGLIQMKLDAVGGASEPAKVAASGGAK